MEMKKIEEKLFVSNSEKYGDKYIEHLLEQYRLYINSVEEVSNRRQKANEFFLALNSALVTLLSYFFLQSINYYLSIITIVASVAGIVICYYWYRIVLSYKGLNSGKFKVLHIIEKRLPLSLYDTEWDVLGRGKEKSKYHPFTQIELKIPWIFILIYTTIILISLFTNVCQYLNFIV